MILVENKYGNGAKFEGAKKHAKIHSKRKFAGQATPYDWTQPLVRNYTQPIKNQYTAGMCGGEMYAQGMQIYRTLALGLPFQELSEISFYSQEYTSPDGMWLGDMEYGAAFNGLTTFQNVPTPVNCTEAQAESKNWQNPQTLQDCLLRTGMMAVSVPIDIDSMAQAIRDYYFIGIMLRGSNNGTWYTANPQPPSTQSPPTWAHYMCSTPNVPALINGKKFLKFYQSWGDKVGESGMQYMGENWTTSGMIVDCFTFVKHTFDQNLQFGMINDDVKYLQVKLGMPSNTLGFGIFGPKTLANVKAYQKNNGITPVSGYVGPLTRAKLNQ